MTMVYIDTSAFIAVIDADDIYHKQAVDLWIDLLKTNTKLICSNYVLLETCALLQRRLGMDALLAFLEYMYPVIKIKWVGHSVHKDGIDTLLAAGRRKLSLVDCVSFAIMRQFGIRKFFSFDKHFSEQGFIDASR